MADPIIKTIGQKCKRCYSCVRECPAKAIRVVNEQAIILGERCISCGHCVKVCSQDAKQIENEVDKVLYNIIPTGKAVAIVAPAFAASFPDNFCKLPSALRQIGFTSVAETAFGADLVSKVYEEELNKNSEQTIISSPCPAVVTFIEKYYPELVKNLAKVVSPMIAMGRYLKSNLSSDCKVVFIGPCTAKKEEYQIEEFNGNIDAVLTFIELKEIFKKLNIDLNKFEDSDFDKPRPNLGKSFPLAGGLLKTANKDNDLLAKDVIVVEGKEKVCSIIEDIAEGKIRNKFVDILFCEGCISGPAIDSGLNYYTKHEKVVDYILKTGQNLDKNVWKSTIFNNRNLDLKRDFSIKTQRRPMPDPDRIKEILAKTEKYTTQDELNCGACGYHTCREYAIAIAKGLAEEDMCLPFLITKLEKAYADLKDTQDQLQNAEKLASIGQLAAGVAHEINNPLGTIMLYASMLKKEVEKRKISAQTPEDMQLIINEANRCKNIVANLLNFARQGKLQVNPVNLSLLIEEITNSIKINPHFADIYVEVNDKLTINEIEADKDQIKQVLLNIINNACESVEESPAKNVTINLDNTETHVQIDILDTGCGIPEENLKKLFTPFFTTKKMGKGTGLGLAISYGIVKMHKGKITVESKEEFGTVFSITIPVKLKLT